LVAIHLVAFADLVACGENPILNSKICKIDNLEDLTNQQIEYIIYRDVQFLYDIYDEKIVSRIIIIMLHKQLGYRAIYIYI
jgi:hypothetical protein